MLRCVACSSKQVVKNGHIHNGKQRYRCKSCGRQFVYGATNKRISEETKAQIDKLLLEKLSLAGIARVLDVSETWLQQYVNQKYANVRKAGSGSGKKRGLVIECDELSSFVATRKIDNGCGWLWTEGRVRSWVVSSVLGTSQGHKGYGTACPLATWTLSATPTCLWAYQSVVFGNRHHRHGKGTQHIERFNCTLRQRVSRLVRKTLSFSKKQENHIGAIWLFVHHYNASLPL